MSAGSLDSFQITRDIRPFTKLLFYLDKVQANQKDFRLPAVTAWTCITETQHALNVKCKNQTVWAKPDGSRILTRN